MNSTRILAGALAAAVLLAASATPAAARKPAPPDAGERPLTQREETASARRIAAAEAYVQSDEARESELASLACVTPTAAGTDASTSACYTPQGFLPVYARDQVNGYYCGPAVGQVIANYSWAVASSTNKYTQARIAGWMATDANGGTSAIMLEAGLEKATAGSPRRPANWDWVVSPLQDLDRDGTSGDELHSYVRSNVSSSKMPLAISIKPHDPSATYHLSSWPRPVSSPGHWITAYGWVGLWNGTDSSRLYYTDSSRDEGGSTGSFWDPMRHINAMINAHTGRFVW